ncbi:MAG: hypothetical protein ABH956_03535, partial [Candidatus Nealsonbacteria bacterium]
DYDVKLKVSSLLFPGRFCEKEKSITIEEVLGDNPPIARIVCNPAVCSVFYGDPLILENMSTDPDGNDDIKISQWSVKNQGQLDSNYNIKSTCQLCNYTPQLGITEGNYVVKLYVEDEVGNPDTAIKDFRIKRSINADFECSLDNVQWDDCDLDFNPMEGTEFYLRDNSTPSEGATINSWTWLDHNNDAYLGETAVLTAKKGEMVIKLTVRDTIPRFDSETHTIRGKSLYPPKWWEIPPFGMIDSFDFLASIFSKTMNLFR